MSTTTSTIEEIAATIMLRRPLPPMDCERLEAGYQLQQQITQQINGEDVADLKAGVTAAAAQKQLGLSTPLIASLYRRGKLPNGCELSLTDGQELECEIGVLVDGEGHPIGVLPVIEVVHLAFSRREDFSVANAVAANLGADRYICGEILPWDGLLTKIQISVYKNDEQIATMHNDYSFGSPAEGAAWLIREAKEFGLWRDGTRDRLLSLGTCGATLPGESGDYQVDFGALGSITFSVL